MIVNSAEPMAPDLVQRLLAEYPYEFRNFYGSVECGRISFECPAGEGLHVNTDCSILEFEDRAEVAGLPLRVFGPPPENLGWSANDRSVVLLVGAAPNRLLIPGDLERSGVSDLLRSGVDLSAEALILPHHGSRNHKAQQPRQQDLPHLSIHDQTFFRKPGRGADEPRIPWDSISYNWNTRGVQSSVEKFLSLTTKGLTAAGGFLLINPFQLRTQLGW